MATERASRLVVAVGNPSRGDDALGPRCLDALAERMLVDVDLLGDFQLQVEHALDIAGRREVIFVDATVSGPAPFSLRNVEPLEAFLHTTHTLSPEAVLATCKRIGQPLPDTAWLLAIRGESFNLGEPLSATATDNLYAALLFLTASLEHQTFS